MTTRLAERLVTMSAFLTNEDACGARADVDTLERAGIVSVEQLIAAIEDATREPSLRAVGCHVLGVLREYSGADALSRLFEEDGDAGTVWEAAKALARLDEKRVAITLVRVLERGGAAQQAAAAWTLGWLGVPATIPALRASALNPQANTDVRAHAIEALGVMHAVGVRQVHETVADLIGLLASESPDLRYWAAYSLGQIGDAASIPALERVASNDDGVLDNGCSVRQEARDALDAIRGTRRE